MKKTIFAMACLFFINGCGFVQYYNVYKVHKDAKESDFGNPPSEEAMKSSESRIRKSFRDPESAIFDWQSPYRCVYPNGLDGATCGWCAYVNINAKNGFGGYAGYSQWLTVWKNNYLVYHTDFEGYTDKVKAF